MPKLPCICGHLIDLNPYPNPHGFRLIPATLIEPIGDKLLELHKTEIDELWFTRHAMSQLGHSATPGIMQIYECEKCGRIAIFARASDEEPVIWYKPEDYQTPEKGKSLNDIVTKLLDTSTKND
jgi:hypothetical protein